jgi:flagellar biosynthesis protein FlhG
MPMRETPSRPTPLDQADGLRRLFAHAAVRFVPMLSNPHVAFGGVMIERITSALAAFGRHTLVVDASERGSMPSDLALLDLPACIERLGPGLSFLAARGLPLRHVDPRGSTHAFLQAVADAAPDADVVLVHAPASDLARMFARHPDAGSACPLLLADDRPASVTHAYAGMKLLAQRAGLVVFDLLLGAAPQSPRAGRIAAQLGSVADQFTGAVLRSAVQVDPASDAIEAPTPALLQLARDWLQDQPADAGPALFATDRRAAPAAALS